MIVLYYQILQTLEFGIIECTKNHLILTTHGYISAECLNTSHYVIHKFFNTSKVLSIIPLLIHLPVYDIEVPKYSNFCLSNGLVVHNSKDIADAVAGLCYMILEDGAEALDTPRKINEILKTFATSIAKSAKNRKHKDIIRGI